MVPMMGGENAKAREPIFVVNVNTPRRMKKNNSNDSNPQPEKLPQFPLNHLLPHVPPGGLTRDHLKMLSERLRAAIAARTDGLTLSEEEAKSFRDNCALIRRVGIGLQLRNYCLLETFKAQQWRANYRTIEEFAKSEANMSRGQLKKCIDSAEIALAMADVGLTAVAPSGRMVEELAKVRSDLRIAAWEEVLESYKRSGKSSEVAVSALTIFCHGNGLNFGKVKPKSPEMVSLCKSLLPGKKKSTKKASIKKTEHTAEWMNQLSASEEQTFCGILQDDLQEMAKAKFDGKNSVTIIGEILQEIATHECDDLASERMEAVFAIMLEKDAPMLTKLFKRMLCQLSEKINQRFEQRLSENHTTRSQSSEAA